MAHLLETHRDKETMTKPFFNVEFPPDQVAQADRLEVWGSDFEEGGKDYSLYRLMSGESKVIAEQRSDGY